MKSDSQVKQDVLEELKWEPAVNATDIGVQVSEGIVSLAGHVKSYAEKWHAERAAQRVDGVRALAVEISVQLQSLSERTDADIARSAENTLEWITNLPKSVVKVMVESGWVTLSGELDWEYQRRSAVRNIRYLMGVTGVSNQISLKARPVSLTHVKADIEAALRRQAAVDSSQILVEVNGGEVTLTGKVSSWSELELTKRSAWNAPGVSSVIDNLTVTY